VLGTVGSSRGSDAGHPDSIVVNNELMWNMADIALAVGTLLDTALLLKTLTH
jgi:hypothetical protein